MADGLSALRAETDTLAPALSDELDERTELDALEDVGLANEMDETARRAMEALYGSEFPLLKPESEDEDWAKWAEALWLRHSAGVRARLHLVERNRLGRKGIQWIASVGYGPWTEPPKPKDAARVVFNVLDDALDQRLQIITEQRPGFRTKPATQDMADLKRAEAQQLALEYQYDQQDMAVVIRELGYWAGTDGVSFGEVYWDPDVGPWHESMTVNELGDAVPADRNGDPLAPGAQPYRAPLGDLKTRVRRIEQVRVSANASATRRPFYWIVRDVMPRGEAIRQHGLSVADSEVATQSDHDAAVSSLPSIRSGYLVPEAEELYREQDLVDRYTVYCEPTEFLPKGLTLIVVGTKVVFKGPLLWGVVPLFRNTDGSSDPSFFCTPQMDGWWDTQMRINAILSKWVENVRLNAGPRLLSRVNAIVGEQLIGGTTSVIEVKGLGSLTDIIREMEAFSVGQDAKELLALEIKNFEDMTGWNPVSRGSFSTEQSGRAILAIREQLERVFTPPVAATAQAMTEWSKIVLAGMAWGYDIPRTIGTMGAGRPDLAQQLSADDFDGATDVFIDPETLMPMPRALRLFLLKDMFQMQLLSPRDYLRRLPFAWTRSLGTPDEDQEARARRVCEAIRRTGDPNALPLKWQDNEAIHQDVLERELILPDDIDPMVQEAANMRWIMLAQQSQMKMMSMMPMGGMGAPPPEGGQEGGTPAGLSPQEQPFQGTSPGIAGGSFSTIGGQPDQAGAAQEFDQQSPL